MHPHNFIFRCRREVRDTATYRFVIIMLWVCSIISGPAPPFLINYLITCLHCYDTHH